MVPLSTVTEVLACMRCLLLTFRAPIKLVFNVLTRLEHLVTLIFLRSSLVLGFPAIHETMKVSIKLIIVTTTSILARKPRPKHGYPLPGGNLWKAPNPDRPVHMPADVSVVIVLRRLRARIGPLIVTLNSFVPPY